MRRRATSNLALVALVFTAAAPLLALSQAATGTYTASTGSTAATGSASGGSGSARGSKSTTTGSGNSITMNVNGWAKEGDFEKLVATQGNPEEFLKTLSAMSYGTATIGGKTVPVNLAWSFKTGSSHQIVLLSEKPLTATSSRTGATANGVAVGYIRLTVDSAGSGTGMMYSTTQVAFQGSDIVARGGGSTATQLSGVAHQ